MSESKQKPVVRKPRIDLGVELLKSVQEMKLDFRARVHHLEKIEFAQEGSSGRLD